ncbi:hypothetical protein FE391_26865 [Nonomuraea sp. KC401]|uniref:hypothetical protein n=1 Tax=unclassified Nonomuraea TaxID=2593643 RepID=UPI0010FD3DA0|nr:MULTISPECIES: hypothetical protein [unclassified Nonomuraea]NBE94753.1 hypothetical protein [Nonomuraea sp. K271]TLF64977.1 hypothetical protein FE391_26865 [Nonomuraea sp. KC401]
MSIEPRAQVAPERVLPGPVPVAPEAAAQQRVVQRICARVAPEGMRIGVGDLPPGGLQVWIETPVDIAAAPESWVLHHRMAREVALVGWHCEADADRLLVLGWSAACLHNRVRLLQSGLRRLAGFEHTAQRAVQLDGQHPDDEPPAQVAAAVCASIERRLRWPERLAELAGFERSSELPHLQLLLAQVAGLEAKVARACEEHLVMARVLARAVCEQYTRHRDLHRAQRDVLAESRRWVHASTMIRGSAGARPSTPGVGRPHMGLAERRIAASVINHGVPRVPRAATAPRADHFGPAEDAR